VTRMAHLLGKRVPIRPLRKPDIVRYHIVINAVR